jgi:hypothetical protein
MGRLRKSYFREIRDMTGPIPTGTIDGADDSSIGLSARIMDCEK